jgi:hypothetical protein
MVCVPCVCLACACERYTSSMHQLASTFILCVYMYFICEYVYTYAYVYFISIFVVRAFSLPPSLHPPVLHTQARQASRVAGHNH